MQNSQIKFVKRQLLNTGQISRNECLQQYISRLGAIINKLNKDGWVIQGSYVKKNGGKDYVYNLIDSPFKKEYYKVEGTGEIISKLVKK